MKKSKLIKELMKVTEENLNFKAVIEKQRSKKRVYNMISDLCSIPLEMRNDKEFNMIDIGQFNNY